MRQIKYLRWWVAGLLAAATALNYLDRQSLVNTVTGLGVFRFLLGMGEGGGFPGSAKAVAEWFPPKERSFAFGIFNTGPRLGAVLAPPLIALIIVQFNL